MLRELFNPSNYFFNPYAVPNIIISLYCFFLVFFVWIKKRMAGLSLLLLNFSAGVWLFSFALMYSSKSPYGAYLWDKISYFLFGGCFISVSGYFVSLDIAKRRSNKKDRLVLYLGYFVMTIFALLAAFTDSFVRTPPQKLYWGYYTDPGIYHHIFLIFFSLFYLKSTWNVYYAYKVEKSILERNKLKVFLACYLIGSFAIQDFLIAYGIGFYPFGYMFVFIYLTLIVYNFIKYKALGIETVVHKTLLWVISIFLIIFPAGIVAFFVSKILTGILPAVLTISILSIVFLFFHIYYGKIRPRIDYFFGKRQYEYYELLGRVSETVSTTLDIEDFSRKLLNELDVCIAPHKVYFWLVDEKQQYLFRFADIIHPDAPRIYREGKKFVSKDDQILKHLKETLEVLEPQIISLNPHLQHLRDSAFFSFLCEETIEVLVPLVMEDKLVGVLGLGRKRSLRIYSKRDIEVLKTLGEELGIGIYNALHHRDILEKQRLQQEIFLAKNIQETLFPKEPPIIPGILLYGLYSPAKEIGGDYYDFIQRDLQFFITIGDVSGKGLDAGLVVSSVKSSLMSLVKFSSSPKDILALLNDVIFREIKEQKFVSLLLLMYESNQEVLKYSSCGHEHIIIFRNAQQDVKIVKSGGIILGMIDDLSSYLEENTLVLNKGDKILLYTDGATEARNPQEELYGLARLIDSFQKHVYLPIKDIIHNVHQDIKGFISTRDQYDDITLVGIEKE